MLAFIADSNPPAHGGQIVTTIWNDAGLRAEWEREVGEMRDRISKETQQHTLGVELRISDEQSWRSSEQKGESHHDAYKFRQLVAVMNRIFSQGFSLPREHMAQLRKDQGMLFP